MKKLLISLGSIVSVAGVTAITAVTVIACGPNKDVPVKKQLSDILKVTDLGELPNNQPETILNALVEQNKEVKKEELEIVGSPTDVLAIVKVKEGSTIYEQGEVEVTFAVDTDIVISDETIKFELQNIIGDAVYKSNDEVIAKLNGAAITGIATIDAKLKTRTETTIDFEVTVTAASGYKLEGTGVVTVAAKVDTDIAISDETIKFELQKAIGDTVYTSNDEVIVRLNGTKIEGIKTIDTKVKTRTETSIDFEVTVTAAAGYKLEGTGIVTVTATVETLIHVSTEGIGEILQGLVGHGQIFGSSQNVIDWLRKASLGTGILVADVFEKQMQDKILTQEITFVVTVKAAAGYVLDGETRFEVVATVKQPEKIVVEELKTEFESR